MRGLIDFINSNWREMLALIGQHFILVLISIALAVAIGLPVGILLSRKKHLQRPILGLANILQTIPSLALFGFLIPLSYIGGIGTRTAIVALVLYALLPVIRNTVTGIEGVDSHVREAAVAMGMTNNQILRQVELPLAMSVILAGVRVATVISVGVATIAAAIGAGGLGTYIFRGLRMNDNALILAGAVPAALMALAADYGLGRLETRIKSYAGGQAEAARGRTQFNRLGWAIALLLVVLGGAFWGNKKYNAANNPNSSSGKTHVVVGSKDFTEQIILGEMLVQTLEAEGVDVERQFELGGNLCHDALVAGRIDLYPEYTGTAYTAILHHEPLSNAEEVYQQVRREYAERFKVAVSDPLGFSNDFAILIRGDEARRLNLKTISDAARYTPSWRAGFGQDFMSRADGYQGFARAYQLKFKTQPREMDLSLTYRALAAGEVDLIAGNSTDGLIAALDLFQLGDDHHYFPPYQAVVMARQDATTRAPQIGRALARLTGLISTEEMRRLNYEVDGEKRSAADVVRKWLQKHNGRVSS